jgi:hypothetical protein
VFEKPKSANRFHSMSEPRIQLGDLSLPLFFAPAGWQAIPAPAAFSAEGVFNSASSHP